MNHFNKNAESVTYTNIIYHDENNNFAIASYDLDLDLSFQKLF